MNTHLMTFQNTSIVLGEGLRQSALLEEACKSPAIVLIADDRIAKLYGKEVQDYLQSSYKEVYLLTFPAGEASKTRATKEKLEDEMQKKSLGRDTTIIGIGGGVTTDLAGFVASTYCRGVPLVLMPTSLLGMVDASIGGKTGVNTPYGKNLIGTFYLPETLIIDFDFLASLPEEGIKEGLVEVIKMALTSDEQLFDEIDAAKETLFKLDQPLKNIIKRACEIKLEVISSDFEEKKGTRRILNFGHTVGHAIEKFFNYEMAHGTAVAIGIIAETFMACELELLKRSYFNRIVKLLKPFVTCKKFDIKQVYDYMILDKKSKDQLPRFVLIDNIGHVLSFNDEYCTPVEKDIVLNALQFIQEI